MIEAYPLYWPEGKQRTPSLSRTYSRFNTTFGKARDELLMELDRLGAKDVIISSNLRLRRDGLPLATELEPKDPGIAVYFTYRKKQHCFASDRWNKTKDNLHAIRLTIEALRGIARWGTGDMMEQAFRGFEALPASTLEDWWVVLGVDRKADYQAVKDKYRMLAMREHPDRGGNGAGMVRLNQAMASCEKELGIGD